MLRNGGQWMTRLREGLGRPSGGIDFVAALEHPDPAVWVFAAGVLWARGGGRRPEDALPVAAEAIRSGDRAGRVFGCHLLAEMGPAAGDVVRLVRELLGHAESMTRIGAAFALLKCCPDKAVLAEARQALAGDPDCVAVYVAAKLAKAIER